MVGIILQKSAEPAKWLIVIGIAYTLAMTIWIFFSTPIAPLATPVNALTEDTGRAAINANWILNKNLFGKTGEAKQTSQAALEAAVQTRLPLELQSVFVSHDQSRSSAIIAQRGKSSRLYRIGDTLPGNATLATIAHDRITLRRAGVRESLQFPPPENPKVNTKANRSQSTRAESPARAPRRQSPTSTSNTADSVSQLKEMFSADAAGTLQNLGIELAAEGGYKVKDISQMPALRQTGLQSGDIILSVNGKPTGDLQKDQMELDNMLAQGTARIEIMRGTRRFFITASLPGRRQ